jgi:hypothetical protein
VALSAEGKATPHRSLTGYWLWPDMQDLSKRRDKDLFILQGRFFLKGTAFGFTPIGIKPNSVRSTNRIHLVFRVDQLVPTPVMMEMINSKIQAWEHAGVPVAGIQIDFDSPTFKLLQYAEFLKEVRARLAKQFILTSTGLGDWITTGNQKDLAKLYQFTSEIFFQLYQGQSPLTPSLEVNQRLARFDHPFRVGILGSQKIKTHEMKLLTSNPRFRGLVLFR